MYDRLPASRRREVDSPLNAKTLTNSSGYHAASRQLSQESMIPPVTAAAIGSSCVPLMLSKLLCRGQPPRWCTVAQTTKVERRSRCSRQCCGDESRPKREPTHVILELHARLYACLRQATSRKTGAAGVRSGTAESIRLAAAALRDASFTVIHATVGRRSDQRLPLRARCVRAA